VPQAFALPQLSVQLIRAVGELLLVMAALTVVEAPIANDAGGGIRNKIDDGSDGVNGSITVSFPGPQPARLATTPIPIININRRHFILCPR
jgi:hypothetical protein